MMKYFHFLILGLCLSIYGCGNDPKVVPNVEDGESYFPLIVGKRIAYQVDSIVFDDAPNGNRKDTISFQIQEVIQNIEVDAIGDTFYVMHRYRRPNSSENWVHTDAWSVTKDREEILRREENLLFLKMQFPLRRLKTWSSTQHIDPMTEVKIGSERVKPYLEWNSVVSDIDHAGMAGGFSFPKGELMTIQLVDDDDDLNKRWVKEVYARGIGLVERMDTILDSRCIELGDFEPCIGKEWLEHADKGYILHQVLIDHD